MSSLANELCEFYCLSYNNKERKAAMASRFQQLNLHVNFYDGVNFEDNRILLKDNNNDNTNVKKCWSCMYGHLDMINKFLNTKMCLKIEIALEGGIEPPISRLTVECSNQLCYPSLFYI